MSSNAPHSSMRRYVIAAIAAIGCLLPAACDVAAASTTYHSDWSGQGQQGGGRHNGGGSKPTGANSTGANSTGANSTGANNTGAAATSAAAGDDQGQGAGNGNGQGQGDGNGQGQGGVDPSVDPSANPEDPAAGTRNGISSPFAPARRGILGIAIRRTAAFVCRDPFPPENRRRAICCLGNVAFAL